MKNLKSWKQIDGEGIYETLLLADPGFVGVLSRIKTDTGIEDILKKWIWDRKDIDTRFTQLELPPVGPGTSDKVLAKSIAGDDITLSRHQVVKIGRLVDSILKSNDIQKRGDEIEKFVNAYRSVISNEYLLKERRFRVCEGEEIGKWYGQEKYWQVGHQNPLGSSCMRFDHMRDRFGIYTQNPDRVEMILLLCKDIEGEEKLLARALVWKTEDGNYLLDKIYYSYPKLVQEVKDWAQKHYPGIIQSGDLEQDRVVRIGIEKWYFEKYPYVDTLNKLIVEKREETWGGAILSNREFFKEKRGYNGQMKAVFLLNSTDDPVIEPLIWVWSDRYEKWRTLSQWQSENNQRGSDDDDDDDDSW